MLKSTGNNTSKPDIRFPPPFMFLGFIMLGVLCDWLFGLPDMATSPFIKWLGGAMIAGAIALIIISLGLFRASGENPEPWTPSTTIVARGPYRHTRNPMYLAMAAAQIGAALWFASPGMLLFVPVALIAIDRFVIRQEESYLERRFGKPYLDYCKRVRRWL